MADKITDRVMDRELSSGSFERQSSRFRDWIGADPRPPAERGVAELPVQAGRYHLYVSLACPWCHRAAILRVLAGLEEVLPVHYVAPFRDERGWAFTGEDFAVDPGRGADSWEGSYSDSLHGWDFMSVAYGLSDPSFGGRVTVPVLWDEQDGRIVNNESSEIIRMLYSRESLGGLGSSGGLTSSPRSSRRRSKRSTPASMTRSTTGSTGPDSRGARGPTRAPSSSSSRASRGWRSGSRISRS